MAKSTRYGRHRVYNHLQNNKRLDKYRLHYWGYVDLGLVRHTDHRRSNPHCER